MKGPFSLRKWLTLDRFWDDLFGFATRVARVLRRSRRMAKATLAFRRLRLQPAFEGLEDRQLMTTVRFLTPPYSTDEGNNAYASITLDTVSDVDVTVTFSATLGSGTNAASADDFTPVASGTVTIPAGVLTAGFTITSTTEDSIDEYNEWFDVTLTSATNAAIVSVYSTTVTIIDDDSPPDVQWASSGQSVSESAGSITVRAVLDGNESAKTITVAFSTIDGTATHTDDYEGVSGGSLSFAPGARAASATIGIAVDDILDEPTEEFTVELSSPSNASLGTPYSTSVKITEGNGPISVCSGCEEHAGNVGARILLEAMSVASSLAPFFGVLGLAASSATARPSMPIAVTVPTPSGSALPDEFRARIAVNGGSYSSVQTFETDGQSAGTSFVLGLFGNTASLASGVYPYVAEVTAMRGTSSEVTQHSGTVLVVNNAASPVGIGWSIMGMPTIQWQAGQGATYLRGDGTATHFSLLDNGTLFDARSTAHLTRNGDGTYTWEDGGYVALFNSSGRPTQLEDPSGQHVRSFVYSGSNVTQIREGDEQWDLAYDGNGRVSTISLLGGRTVTLTHDTAGALTGVALPDGTVRSYGYNSDGRMTSANDGAVTTTYTYSSHGLLNATNRGGTTETVTPQLERISGAGAVPVSEAYGESTDGLGNSRRAYFNDDARPTAWMSESGAYPRREVNRFGAPVWTEDPLGNRTTYTFASGTRNVTRIDYPDGTYVTAEYDPDFNLPTVQVDELGARTTFAYNSDGQLIRRIDALGAVTTFTYASGRLATVVDPLNRTTTLLYDSNGHVQTLIDPAGLRTTSVYDSAGNRTVIQWPNGNVTTTTYDAMRRVVSVSDAASGTVTNVYDSAGRQIATIDPYGNRTTVQYDSAGRPQVTLDPYGARTTATYDAAGRLVSVIDPDGNVTTTVYDVDDRPIATIDPYGNRTTAIYDVADRVTAAVDAFGRTTTFQYDLRDRLVASIDPYGNRATTVYDAAGRAVESIDPYGNVTTAIYDAVGQMTALVDPFANRTTTAYDASGAVVSILDRYGHYTTFVYDSAGRQSAVIDVYGHRTTTTYSAAGQVSALLDVYGRATTFAYDAVGRMLATQDPLGNRTTAVYGLYGRVDAVVDPLGNRATTLYDSRGRVETTIDVLGNRTTVLYDARGRLEAAIDPHGNRTTALYDARGRIEAIRDALGNRTTAVYDSRGREEATIDPLGHRSTTVYDADGRFSASVDALGARTTAVYDERGRLNAVIDALGRRSTFVYDSRGQIEAAIDATDARSTVLFDDSGRFSAFVDALGNRTTIVYDAYGRYSATVDALDRRSTLVFDDYGRISAMIDALGARATVLYDSYGRMEAAIDPLGGRTTAVYDSYGRNAAIVDALGARTTTVFDAYGRAEAQIDALGRRTTSVFDSYGRQIATVDPLGARFTATYDSYDRVVAQIDPAGNVTTTVYDAQSRVVEAIDALGNSTTIAYDALNRPSSRTDRLGRRIDFSYDAVGNSTGQVWYAVDGTTVAARLTFTFDAMNRQTSAANASGAWTMSYDALGRTVHVDQPLGVGMTFAYDSVGNRTGVQDSFGGVETSVYDATNRLARRELSVPVDGAPDATLRTDFAYDALGRRVSEARYADLSATTLVAQTTSTYDAVGRVTRLETRDASALLLADFQYGYDVGGRVTSKSDDGVLTTYTFDDRRQLTAEDTSGTSADRSYSYDSNGNRTMSGYVHGADNRLLSDGTWNYTYNAEGAVIEKERISDGLTWHYYYDHWNQLTKAERATDGSTVDLRIEYKYDAWGDRVGRSIDRDADGALNPEVARFAIDAWNPAREAPLGAENVDVWADLEVDGTLGTRYLRSDLVDDVSARMDDLTGDPEKYWYVADHLGSTRKLLDADANVANALTYDGYGNILTETDSSVRGRYAWTGRELDVEANLQFNRARVYDSTVGRWLSSDPLGFAAGDSNLYRYVANAPLDSTDPSGLESIEVWHNQVFWVIEQPGMLWNSTVRKQHIGFLKDGKVQVSEEFGGGLLPLSEVQGIAGSFWNFSGDISKLPIGVQNSAITAALHRVRERWAPTPSDPSLVGVFAGSIYDSTVGAIGSIASGKAGEALGDRAVAITERFTGKPFGTSIDQFQIAGAAIALDIIGVNGIVEGVSGQDLATGEQLDGAERWTRGAAGTAGVITTGLGIGAAATGGSLLRGTTLGRVASNTVGRVVGRIHGVLPAPVQSALARINAFLNTEVSTLARDFWHRLRGGKCFVAGTLVSTEHGALPIEEVTVGTKVWALDHRDGRWKLRPVVETFAFRHDDEIVQVMVAGERIESTEFHPYWVIDGESLADRPAPEHSGVAPKCSTVRGRWVDATDLRVGDILLLRDGRTAPVSELARRQGAEHVYNFHVEELGNYSVGVDGVLVHNTCELYRGGADLTPRLGVDVVKGPDGLIHPTNKKGKPQGLSINSNPNDVNVQKWGGAFRVDGVPDGLQVLQSGNPGHYVIAPAQPMTFEAYEALCKRVKLADTNWVRQ